MNKEDSANPFRGAQWAKNEAHNDFLGRAMVEIKRIAQELPFNLEDLDLDHIGRVLESALRMTAEERPQAFLEALKLDAYVAEWMPKGEIWLFDGDLLEDSVNLFAGMLLAVFRGAIPPVLPELWNTEGIIGMFRRYMAMQAGGRIVGLATDEEEDAV